MHKTDDDSLDGLTSRELLELQARIHDAIRAQIRLRNAEKAAAAAQRLSGPAHLPQVEQSRRRSLAVHAKTLHVEDAAVAVRTPVSAVEQPQLADNAFDLERERDAWMARKRSSAR